MGCGGSKDKKGAAGATTADDAQKAKRDNDKQEAKGQNKEFQTNMQFLSQVPLLKRLPKDQHPLLAASCISVDFSVGSVIIKQGDAGNEFFVIKTGEAAVQISDGSGAQPNKVATLKGGDYFGENALLRDEPRTATIVAESAMQCLKITRDKFQELQLHEKLQFAKRNAVAGGGDRAGTVATKDPSPKNAQEEALMAKALRENENLQTMVALDEDRIKNMIAVAWREDVPAQTDLIKEGDLQADYFYVVQEGSFDIYVSGVGGEDGTIDATQSKHVGSTGVGGSFGELALLYLVPRAATVKAKSKSVVWVIDRKNFKNILMKVSDEKIKEYVKLLDAVDLLSSLTKEEKNQVAQALVEMHFTKGEAVLQQGEPGNTFYILYEGEVSVIKDDKVVTNLSANQSTQTSQFFGERALLKNEVRAATVKVVSGTAKALALDRDSFTLLLGPLEDIMKAHEEGSEKKTGAAAKETTWQRKRIARKDLNKLGLLGCGGFGYVELWEHTKTKETYAMKALNKGYIVKTHMQDGVMNEKLILTMTNSQFIIRLYDTYNGQQTLYFLLEPALGGELHAVYHRKGFHGSEKHAMYYIAGVVCAFEHLHDRHIIYRDLKPENLLITEKGHPKLTDMGLAKFVIGRTFTTCGTPDYFAPELIASTGHTKAVDWWTLGILLFEFMSGHPPFESPHPMQIYSKVMKGINKVPFPPKCQGAVADLIRCLLQKEPSERLPIRPGGVNNIRTHKWMAAFDWPGLMAVPSAAEPPYVPPFKGPKDISNFNARKEDMPRQIEYKDDGSGWDKDF